jgi:hypothetical protein
VHRRRSAAAAQKDIEIAIVVGVEERTGDRRERRSRELRGGANVPENALPIPAQESDRAGAEQEQVEVAVVVVIAGDGAENAAAKRLRKIAGGGADINVNARIVAAELGGGAGKPDKVQIAVVVEIE